MLTTSLRRRDDFNGHTARTVAWASVRECHLGGSVVGQSEIADTCSLMQNDPMHPAFEPQTPWWVLLVGVLILLGLLIYALVR
jgi:hypothetical protein